MSKLRRKNGIYSYDVTYANDVVIATVFLNLDGEYYEWTSSSKLDPLDEFDYEIGTKLALGRTLEKAGKQLVRQANGRVKNVDDNRQQSALQKAEREAAAKPKTTRKRVLKAVRLTEG